MKNWWYARKGVYGAYNYSGPVRQVSERLRSIIKASTKKQQQPIKIHLGQEHRSTGSIENVFYKK